MLTVSPMENHETVTFCDSTTNPENMPRQTLKKCVFDPFPQKTIFSQFVQLYPDLPLNLLGAVLAAAGDVPGHPYVRTEYHDVLRHWSGSRK